MHHLSKRDPPLSILLELAVLGEYVSKHLRSKASFAIKCPRVAPMSGAVNIACVDAEEGIRDHVRRVQGCVGQTDMDEDDRDDG